VTSPGKHNTTVDAALFAIDMARKNLVSTLSKADHSRAEIVTESRIRLIAVGSKRQRTLPSVASIKRHVQIVRDAGGRVVLIWLRVANNLRVIRVRGSH
jgi:hypothetical protein